MPFLLSPICNDQQVDINGAPLSGGIVSTYVAGTSTPAPSYTSISGSAPQTNPIILDTLGLPPQPIWLDSGFAYKFIIADALGVVQRVVDDVSGISSSTPIQDQWVIYGSAPTYLTPTSFSVAGDQTSIFQVGRRVRTINTGGVIYSTVLTSVFTTLTTVTLVNDSGVLDAGLSQVAYGLLSPINPSFTPIPAGSITSWFQAAAPIGWTKLVTQNNKAIRIVSGTGGGLGGSVAFTTAFASQAVSGSNSATTLTESQMPGHTHNVGNAAQLWAGQGAPQTYYGGMNTGVVSNQYPTIGAGGSASHNHTFTGTAINLAVQYIDMILASKN